MRKLVVLTLALVAWIAKADDGWVPMTGDEIEAALVGRTLQYARAWQRFDATGQTLYHAGRDSWGRWRVQGAQYCSTWPPQDLWACYDMARKNEMIRFIDQQGETIDARYKDE